ncbi:MAG: CbtA family protein [Reyranella sp.]|nr:CbtA family protein [Reyranella sp.]
MLSRILSVGLLAGLVAGLLIAALQQVTTTPLILAAETYEKPVEVSAAPKAPHSHHGTEAHSHGDGWKPADGLPRFFFTAVTTVATAIGVAFVLIAIMVFAGVPIDEGRALAWAIAGFVACGLAPAAGLAPELPGAASGDVVGRQLWWVGTAIATAVGLWGFLRAGHHPAVRLGAIVLLLAPHFIGAPHAHEFESKVPAEIAAQFTALSLVVQALLWTLVGVGIGMLWPKFAPKTAG